MIAELFQKTTLKSYFASIILCFLTVIFIHYCKNNGILSIEFLPRIIIFWLIFSGIIFLISFLENKNSVNTFRAIHLLSFPLFYLFFPHGKELVLSKILIAVLIIFSKYSYSRIFNEKKSYLRLFDLSFIIVLLILYNKYFSFFLIIPISVLFYQKYRDLKHLVSFLIPLISLPFIIKIFHEVFFYNYNFFLDFNYLINTWKIEQNFYYSEIIWFISIFISIISSVLFLPRRFEKVRYQGFIFMMLWLYISIIMGFFSLQKGEGEWFLSFIPVAYFSGIFIEKIKLTKIRNIVIYLLFFIGVIFKLIENNII
ncbi:MAG: hypothetical protein CMC33_02290 [Flavobacteriaceae bacterium]|nr:hypothetical protein [Flavobacteriaceae bacterium]|tara:strand:- start:1248 stop:2183 length:936 start_codon:yes stop_codon:yes gene_type:complete